MTRVTQITRRTTTIKGWYLCTFYVLYVHILIKYFKIAVNFITEITDDFDDLGLGDQWLLTMIYAHYVYIYGITQFICVQLVKPFNKKDNKHTARSDHPQQKLLTFSHLDSAWSFRNLRIQEPPGTARSQKPRSQAKSPESENPFEAQRGVWCCGKGMVLFLGGKLRYLWYW